MHDTHAHRRRIVVDDTLSDAAKAQILQALPKALPVRPAPAIGPLKPAIGPRCRHVPAKRRGACRAMMRAHCRRPRV